MAIVEEGNRFRAGDGSLATSRADNLSDRRRRDVFAAGNLVGLLDGRPVGILERFARIDRRTEFAVRQQSIAVWVNAGGHGGAIHVGRSEVDGMMLGKRHAFLGKFPKHRGITLRDKIRPHAVPYDNDDVALAGRRFFFGMEKRGEETGEESERARKSHGCFQFSVSARSACDHGERRS